MSAKVFAIDRDLESDDPETRRCAAARITSVDEAQAVDLIIRALSDEDWRVRKQASQTAVEFGPVPALLARLVSVFQPGDNVGLRNAAVEALTAFGAHAVRVVVDALASLDADGRKLATEVLGRAQDASALPALEQLMCDPDPNVRMGAIEAMGGLGEMVIDAASRNLVRALSSEDVQERLAALEGLNRLGVVVPWPKLAPLTHDPILRRPALAAASRSGSPQAAAELSVALEDDNPNLFRLALIGLADLVLGEAPIGGWQALQLRLGPTARARVLEALTPDAGDAEVRAAALVVAALVQEPAGVDVAIDALVDDRIALEAEAALAFFGPNAVPRLLARVAHGDAPLRAAVIGKLAGLRDPQNDAAIRRALCGAIVDPSPEVACAALDALGELGGPEDVASVFALVSGRSAGVLGSAERALGALAARYRGEARANALAAERDEESRIAICVVIGALRDGVLGSEPEDVMFLAAALSSPDCDTRKAAIIALGDVGSALAVDAVQFALADEERDVQTLAIRAFGRLRTAEGNPVGTDRLIEILQESTEPTQMVAVVRALGDCDDDRAHRALAPMCQATHPAVAVAAIEVLGRSSSSSKVDTLVAAVSHAHSEVVKAALLALEGVRQARVRDCFGRSLSHSEWDVRRLAADCLGRFGGEIAAELLRDRLTREPEEIVKEAIGRALNLIEVPSTARRMATIAPPKAES